MKSCVCVRVAMRKLHTLSHGVLPSYKMLQVTLKLRSAASHAQNTASQPAYDHPWGLQGSPTHCMLKLAF